MEFEVPADKIQDYVELQVENRFELVEKTTDATKIRVAFELKQLLGNKPLPFFRTLFDKADLVWSDADIEKLEPVLDPAIKERISVRGQRTYTTVLDETGQPQYIMADVVVNIQTGRFFTYFFF